MKIFDTHCHLNDEQLYPNINEIIERANGAGIEKILVVGWDKKSSELAVKIAHDFECCYAAVGFHPENVYDITENNLIETLDLCKDSKVVAIGEIGLDHHWCKDPKKQAIQKEFFIKQIEYANEHKMPVVIHNRDAFEECLNILKEHTPKYGGTMHCFSGSVESMKTVIELGLYIGLDGPVTFKNAVTPKEVACEVPLDKLLLETDSPYLAPHPLRGTLNEPENLRLILDEIAIQKNLSKKHIAEATYNNACKLFGI